MPHPSAFIHAMAVIDGSVSIGARTKVWQFASVIRSAHLGEDCAVGDSATVDGARVGDRCKIGKGAAVNPGVQLAAGVFVGPGVIFLNDAYPSVESDGFDIERMLSGEFITIHVGEGASIGAGATIMPGMIIGAGALVAAGSFVDRHVPAGMLWQRDGRVYPMPVSRGRNRMREAKCFT